MYTLESLKEINHANRYLNESVVAHVNKCVTEIENDRTPLLPTYGDIVKYTDETGEYFACASVQPADGFTGDNQINLCQSGSHGHYCNHHISTSGGPWCNVDKSLFKLIGKATASFWVWGYNGACANGGVDFVAEVNLWECNLNEQKYSTEFYDRQFITKLKEPDEYGYRYSGRNIAFRTESDYKAWLKTFNGIETRRLSEASAINWSAVVWHDKEVKHYVSKETYDSIENYVIDTCLCNGVRRCKRVYGEHKVDTYITYDIPELDWRSNKEYARARLEA